jgi:ubiquinone/menaquinone biosynthesis C-methylase UbiE
MDLLRMFLNPNQTIESLGLLPAMNVADFGAGSGFYALAAARAVGDRGKVFAIDIQKELLDRLKNEARRNKLLNIDVVWGDIEKPRGSGLRDSSVDSVLVTNVLFQVKDKTAVAKEALRVLKLRGSLLVVDWRDSFGSLGPRGEDVITVDQAQEIFILAGFSFEKRISAGEHHYGIIFKKS